MTVRKVRMAGAVGCLLLAACGSDLVEVTQATVNPDATEIRTTDPSVADPAVTDTSVASNASIEPNPPGLLIKHDLAAADLEFPGYSDQVFRGARSIIWTDTFETINWFGLVDSGSAVATIGTDVLGGALPNTVKPFTLCGDNIAAIVETNSKPQLVLIDPIAASRTWAIDLDGDAQVVCGTSPVIVLQFEDRLEGRSAEDGGVLWTKAVQVDDPPEMAGNVVLVGTYGGIGALDADSGEPLWAIEDSDSADSGFALGQLGFGVRIRDEYRLLDLDGHVELSIASDEVSEDLYRLVIGGVPGNLTGFWPDTSLRISKAGLQTVDENDLSVPHLLGAASDLGFWAIIQPATPNTADSPPEIAAIVVQTGEAVAQIDVPNFDDVMTGTGFVVFDNADDDNWTVVAIDS